VSQVNHVIHNTRWRHSNRIWKHHNVPSLQVKKINRYLCQMQDGTIYMHVGWKLI